MQVNPAGLVIIGIMIAVALIVLIGRIFLAHLIFKIAGIDKTRFREVFKAIFIISAIQGLLIKIFFPEFFINIFDLIPLRFIIQEGPFSIKEFYSTGFTDLMDFIRTTSATSPKGLILDIPNAILIFNLLTNLIPIIYFFFLTKFTLKLEGRKQIIAWIILSSVCFSFTVIGKRDF